MSEEDRMAEYHKRGYEWPLPELVPNTEGWRRIFDRRFKQLERIRDSTEKYNGWVQTMSAAIVAKNFTENGTPIKNCFLQITMMRTLTSLFLFFRMGAH